MRIREFLLGRPIPDSEADLERLKPASALPALGLDALASAAYGPEAALTVLIPLGMAGLRLIGPITAVILGVLFFVQVSYRQTIEAYPEGGGSYTVAKENLGYLPSLFAAAALAVDYILNVAVAVSAGVGAVVSAFPRMERLTLPLCLALLTIITITNLRGLRTAGVLFMIPTYSFIGCLFLLIGVGVAEVVTSSGHPAPVVAPPWPRGTSPFGAWIVLRAFASGCTAMTGVEAVSNAVPVFRQPTRSNAKLTLALTIGTLAILLAGVAFLSRAYHVGATEPGQPGYESVLSQLFSAVFGRGAFYGLSMASVVSVLALSANTSFADFPRLCRALALDRHLPIAFAHMGRRLVYSTGVVFLAALAGTLLVVFRGITDRLVALFAVGAFSAFTLSQLGMVHHWKERLHDRHARRSLWANGLGAFATAATLIVILVSKFGEGAWMIVLFVPALVALFLGTRASYDSVERESAAVAALDPFSLRTPVVIVPLRRLDAVSVKALVFSLGISREVHAVQVLAEGHPTEELSRVWFEKVVKPTRAAGIPAPTLAVLRSPYRDVVDPLLGYVRRIAAREPARFVAVVIPEIVERRWYHYLLFSHTATALKMMLLFHGGPQVVVVNTPWYLPPARHRSRRDEGSLGLAAKTADA